MQPITGPGRLVLEYNRLVARKPTKFKMTREQQVLATENLNLARREAWRIQRSTGIEYNTLESVAFEGLCKAAHRYDPDRPHPVTGHTHTELYVVCGICGLCLLFLALAFVDTRKRMSVRKRLLGEKLA